MFSDYNYLFVFHFQKQVQSSIALLIWFMMTSLLFHFHSLIKSDQLKIVLKLFYHLQHPKEVNFKNSHHEFHTVESTVKPFQPEML